MSKKDFVIIILFTIISAFISASSVESTIAFSNNIEVVYTSRNNVECMAGDLIRWASVVRGAADAFSVYR